MDIEGKYSNQDVAVKVNQDGNLLVNQYSAKYYELIKAGNVYSVCNQTGITTQAGLSATTPALTLFNPSGSGVTGVLLFAGCVNTVAFAAASVIWLGANTNVVATAVSGTETTAHRNNYLGTGSGNKVKAYLAATLPTAPVAISTLGVGLTGAITTIPQIQTLGRWYDGAIVLKEGTAISFQTSTASGASGFFGEFIWAEI
jgi:hypothetical protein